MPTSCDDGGFIRNLRDGFYHPCELTGEPHIPNVPQLARVCDDLTQILAGTYPLLSTTYDDVFGSV